MDSGKNDYGKRLERVQSNEAFSLNGDRSQNPWSRRSNGHAAATAGGKVGDSHADLSLSSLATISLNQTSAYGGGSAGGPGSTSGSGGGGKRVSQYSGSVANESLLDGFVLLRIAQMLNIGVYYIGLGRPIESNCKFRNLQPNQSAATAAGTETGAAINNSPRKRVARSDLEAAPTDTSGESNVQQATDATISFGDVTSSRAQLMENQEQDQNERQTQAGSNYYHNKSYETGSTLLEDWINFNPLRSCFGCSPRWSGALWHYLTIAQSLVVLLIGLDKTLSTILLCLMSRSDLKTKQYHSQHSASLTPMATAQPMQTPYAHSRFPAHLQQPQSHAAVGSLAAVAAAHRNVSVAAATAAATTTSLANEASDVGMSWLVLVLINLCSLYILFSTIFNGHLLWSLLSQRLFLVSRRFQYKTMLSLLIFIYLEYIINISFVNNLYGWSFEATHFDPADISRALQGPAARANSANSSVMLVRRTHTMGGASGHNKTTSALITESSWWWSPSLSLSSINVLDNLRIFVTERDEANRLLDALLTFNQFARGIIRISPYITINYVIICLKEHIRTIRNQNLLTESLKKRQKLRMVVKSKRANLRASVRLAAQQADSKLPVAAAAALAENGENPQQSSSNGVAEAAGAAKKKRVIFVTQTSGVAAAAPPVGSLGGQLNEQTGTNGQPLQASPISQLSNSFEGSTAGHSPTTGDGNRDHAPSGRHQYSRHAHTAPTCAAAAAQSINSEEGVVTTPMKSNPYRQHEKEKEASRQHSQHGRKQYLDRVRDFDELESYVTNLYIFTGRLNRLMSRQGLAMFFIVHNLMITCTLIVPEAIRGGPPTVLLIRCLAILVAIVPFFCGQSLNFQLEQLSRQIDRIIIQQQFTSRRRDNLVRIRELLHDIRINCGGMLNFNVETGIKYLVVAFASAFFIEQEGEYYKTVSVVLLPSPHLLRHFSFHRKRKYLFLVHFFPDDQSNNTPYIFHQTTSLLGDISRRHKHLLHFA